jgi:hypothetical protein
MTEPNTESLDGFLSHFFFNDDVKPRIYLWQDHLFATKERNRLREKDKRRQERQKAIRNALPPEQRPKLGRPRKNPPLQPAETTKS